MAILANIVADHSAAAIDVASATGFSVLGDGASLGHAVESAVFGRVFDGETVSVAGVSFDTREVQLPVLIEAASVAQLQARLDALDVVLRDATRFGGWLTYESDGSAEQTRYRISVAKRAPVSLAEYEAFKRARVVVSLVVDPLGLGAETTVLSTLPTVSFPRVLSVSAPGGTHDALAAVRYTPNSGLPSVMMYAWWPAAPAHNYVWNGGAEAVGTSSTVAYGWVATAVSGVISAATSVTRTTTAGKFNSGVAGFEVVTPATTDTGASFRIMRRGGFKAGVTYTALCFVKSAGGSTTAVRMKLGASGDLATGSASALTSSFALRLVTWTPSVDRDVAFVTVGVSAATATTFQFDDVQVYEGAAAPAIARGGFGPGIITGASYDLARASLAGGTAWTLTTDSDYVVGFGPQASGALSTNGNLEYPILPHLFTPDDYTDDEVQVAVFARVELASTQTSLACAISVAPETPTGFGPRRYGSFSSIGKALKLPSSGTVFSPYFLGTLTLRVNRALPRREWLRLAFTNAGGASGTVGVDYLIVVPVRSCARSQSGDSASIVPVFVTSTDATKIIDEEGAGSVEYTIDSQQTVAPDDGLGGARPRIPRGGCELLVWPSDKVVDLTDASSASMAMTFTGTVVVKATPRYHLLKQA